MGYSKVIDLTRKRLQEAWEGKLILEAKRVQDQDEDNTEGKSWTPYGDSCHLLWMLEEMERFYEQNSVGDSEPKLNRWLGFVQGALWAHGMATIDELRNDVLSSK